MKLREGSFTALILTWGQGLKSGSTKGAPPPPPREEGGGSRGSWGRSIPPPPPDIGIVDNS